MSRQAWRTFFTSLDPPKVSAFVMLPPAAGRRIDELLAAVARGDGRSVEVRVNAFRHRDGSLRVTTHVDGERFQHTVPANVDTATS